jgi:hypothetical protein
MNKFTVFFCTGLLAFTVLFTGCTGSSLSKADEAKSRMQYKIAGDLYTILGPKVKGPNAKEDQAKAREEAAYCYRMANEYEKAIKSVGSIVEVYDTDKSFPVYGFGGIPHGEKQVNHCFPLNGDSSNPEVKGTTSMVDLYKKALPTIKLYGPTYFAEIMKQQIKMRFQVDL